MTFSQSPFALSTLPPILLFFYLIVGSSIGCLAYFLTSRVVNIDSAALKPLGFCAYLALFAATKIGLERIGGGFWVVVAICAALWIVAISLRSSSTTSLFDRVTFFGCALLMASVLWGIGMAVLCVVWITTNTFPNRVSLPVSLTVYTTVTLASVFAAPLLDHLYQFAMSMRPKPD